MKKTIQVNQDFIFNIYGDYILNQGIRPKNIYLFAKENGFEEKDFYNYFSSFEHIERQMLVNLFHKSVALAAEVNDNEEVSSKEKLLNVYFILFENFTMNRSLVKMILGEGRVDALKNLAELRTAHREFVKTLNLNSWEILKDLKNEVKNIQDKSKEEILWLHFLSCIEFWKNDTSAGFEKTDIYLEKTIDTGFEIMENEPLRKIIDLGKFLWKEKMK